MEMLYFKVFRDFISIAEALDNGARGKLFLALLQYVNGREIEKLSGGEQIAFLMMKNQIDRDWREQESRIEINRENGRKGGRPRKANGFEENRTVFTETEKSHNKEKEEEKEKEDKRENTKEKTLEREFESLWSLYPKKQGKKRAFEAFCRDRKKGRTYEEIHNGILAYKAYLSAEGTPDKYVKQGDTFFAQASWQDKWVPSRNTGSGGRWDLVPEEERDTELPF